MMPKSVAACTVKMPDSGAPNTFYTHSEELPGIGLAALPLPQLISGCRISLHPGNRLSRVQISYIGGHVVLYGFYLYAQCHL